MLGFVELFREDGDARRARMMGFGSGSFSVGLVEHKGNSGHFDATRIGLDHLAFTVASRDDLVGWSGQLSDLGVAHSGVIEIPAGAILNFQDPDRIALASCWER